MARATVTVNGRTSKPAAKANSLVDRPFLAPFLVRKIGGKGPKGEEKVAIVVRDDAKSPNTNTMVVAPTRTGEPSVWVGRKNADKFYEFVRDLRPDEAISFPGVAAGPARAR